MKKYSLVCPKCSSEETIFASLSEPEKLFCQDCNEDLDIEEIRSFVNSWKEYLDDIDKMKAQEKAEEDKDERKN